MKLIIDRFEDSYAVCEKEDLSHVKIERSLIPDAASEGSVIVYCGGRYTVDERETEARRRLIKEKLDRLFKD